MFGREKISISLFTKKKKKVITYLEGKKPTIEYIEKDDGKKYTSLLQRTCENSNTIEDDINKWSPCFSRDSLIVYRC